VGVVLGALVTAGFQWSQARLARSQAARTDQGDDSAIATDLRHSLAVGIIQVSSWAENRTVLAGTLSDREWDALSMAYFTLSGLAQGKEEEEEEEEEEDSVLAGWTRSANREAGTALSVLGNPVD
jgi:hypothetical protein